MHTDALCAEREMRRAENVGDYSRAIRNCCKLATFDQAQQVLFMRLVYFSLCYGLLICDYFS